MVTGFPADGRHQSLRTVFSQDSVAPNANGRPHWSTEEGGHLYYSTTGKWFLCSSFKPTELKCAASFTTDGSPVGEAMCQFLDMSLKHADGTMGKFVRRPLTVEPVFPVCDFCSTHGQEAPDGYRWIEATPDPSKIQYLDGACHCCPTEYSAASMKLQLRCLTSEKESDEEEEEEEEESDDEEEETDESDEPVDEPEPVEKLKVITLSAVR